MKIHLIVVGKTKNDFIKLAEQEYQKRLRKFITLDYIVVKSHVNEKGQSKKIICQKEGQSILAKIGTREYLMVLDSTGAEFSSEKLTAKIIELENYEVINIIIGGTYGLSAEVLARADFVLSLSKLTFTHEMVREIILEQLYRVFTIKNNIPYHY